MAERKRFRRTSINMREGLERKYEARVETDCEGDQVTWRIYSRTVDRHVVFRGTGNLASDMVHLETICERMDEFDRNNRVRPVPKPTSQLVRAPRVMLDRCPLCGGDGVIEDETGYPTVCVCRGVA